MDSPPTLTEDWIVDSNPDRTSSAAATRLGWVAVAMVAGLGIWSVALAVQTGWNRVEEIGLGVGHLCLAALGALVVAHRAPRRLGWLFVGIGLIGSASLTATQIAYLSAVRGDDIGAGRAATAVADIGLAIVVVQVMLVALLLPDGRPMTPRWGRVTGVVIALGLAATAASVANAIRLPARRLEDHIVGGGGPPATAGLGIAFITLVAVCAWAVLLRLHRARGRERRQLAWVVLATAVVLIHFPIMGVIGNDAFRQLTPGVVTMMMSGALAVAFFRHRLWDLDQVIRGSVVYASLWLAIGVAYLGAAAALGVSASSHMPIGLAIGLTVLATMAFQPARRGLEGLADRWVFGVRAAPQKALGELGDLIGGAEDPGDIAVHLAKTARAAVRLEWVEVTVSGFERATDGQPNGGPVTTIDLTSRGRSLGVMRCRPVAGHKLGADDAALLAALSSQAALAIANAQLATRVLHAQAAERRRIERDLHDGAQQELVALVTQLGLAGAGSNGRGEVFDRLRRDAQNILAGLRDLAQGIYPSVLTDGGLYEALRERASHCQVPVAFDVAPDLRVRRFPEDIEVAAYFFVSEALANVAKHSDCSATRIELTGDDDTLTVRVGDDGAGFDPAATEHRGLAGLADRLRAAGGRIEIDAHPGAGTCVTAVLPLDTRSVS